MKWLRPTAIQRYESCPEQSRLTDVVRVRTIETSSALVFGSCVHRACLGLLVAQANGETFDPVARFEEEWDRELSQTRVRFNSIHNEAGLRAIGVKLCSGFADAWSRLGLFPVTTDSGLLVEKRLRIKLSETVGLSGEPDIIAMDRFGRIWIIDLKTPATKAFEGFAGYAEQLTAYQLLYDAHADHFGLPKVSRLAFFEGLKQKGATWEWQEADRHSQDLVDNLVGKILRTSALMDEGFYPKRSASSFNSPCNLCDLVNLCRGKSTEGYILPEGFDIHKELFSLAA